MSPLSALKTLRNFESGSAPNIGILGGKNGKSNLKSSKSLAKKGATIVVVLFTVGFMLLIYIANVLSPINLVHQIGQGVVSVATTIFEKAKNVVRELMDKGEVPDEITKDLEKQGIELGTETTTGGFIVTNRVIASGKDYLVAAADGSTYMAATGSLSIRYKGKIVTADNLETELETNDEFFRAFYNAIEERRDAYDDASANSAETVVYEDLGISKDVYDGLEYTGDGKADQAAFEAIYAEILNNGGSSTNIGTRSSSDSSESSDQDSSQSQNTGGDASSENMQVEEYIRKIADNTSGNSVEEATEKAGALINAAVSANEPYYAARAYAGIVEAIEIKTGDTTAAPVNQAMNLLVREETSTAFDPATGSAVEVKGSAIYSPNIRSLTTGDVGFDKDTASGYSRDRVMNLVDDRVYKDCGTDAGAYEATNETIVSVSNIFQAFWRWFVALFTGETKADPELLVNISKDSVEDAIFTSPSESLKGQTLGERIVQGAAYLNASEARGIGGSVASDQSAVIAYNDMVQSVIARKAEAERNTMSPFDVSSPNTFLGSLVRSLSSVAVSGGSFMSKISAANTLTSKSLATISTGAYADAAEKNFATVETDYCTSVPSVGGVGDMFCNENPTFDKSTMTMTLEELEEKLAGDLDASGAIKDGSLAAQYAILHTDRAATPGPQDASVCEAAQNLNHSAGTDAVANACQSFGNRDIATGKEYANTAANTKWNSTYRYYQGYFLETYVLDLLGYYRDICADNPVVAYKEKYYTEFPKDNSPEGILARRTGLSKAEVIEGIEAINFLAWYNSYDPSTRLAFMAIPTEKPLDLGPENSKESELAEDNKKYFHSKVSPVTSRVA
ncbi:hypothetical protein IKE71_03435 [Candidatus Saccharibacteria bacterium]|nr:hypothetical protein [Candidatus Saccharibacteria bacterium]